MEVQTVLHFNQGRAVTTQTQSVTMLLTPSMITSKRTRFQPAATLEEQLNLPTLTQVRSSTENWFLLFGHVIQVSEREFRSYLCGLLLPEATSQRILPKGNFAYFNNNVTKLPIRKVYFFNCRALAECYGHRPPLTSQLFTRTFRSNTSFLTTLPNTISKSQVCPITLFVLQCLERIWFRSNSKQPICLFIAGNSSCRYASPRTAPR